MQHGACTLIQTNMVLAPCLVPMIVCILFIVGARCTRMSADDPQGWAHLWSLGISLCLAVGKFGCTIRRIGAFGFTFGYYCEIATPLLGYPWWMDAFSTLWLYVCHEILWLTICLYSLHPGQRLDIIDITDLALGYVMRIKTPLSTVD
jgi:hypothetical protein